MPDSELKNMNMMSGCVTQNLEMLLERDYRVSQIILANSRSNSGLGDSLLTDGYGISDLAQDVRV